MKTTARSFLAVLGALALGTCLFAAAELGKPAPEFTLVDASGANRSLSEFKGKVVVLEWVNLGCPYVKHQYDIGNMQRLQKTYTGREVVWLSICSSASGKQGYHEPAAWKSTMAERGMGSTAVLIDAEGTVGRLYGAKTTPHMFVIDAQGTLAYNGALDSAATTNRDETVRAKNHVAAAVDALLAGKAVEVASTRPYGCGIKYK